MTIEELFENRIFIHREHKEWLNQLNFYQEEVQFFQNELMLILHENPRSFSKLEYVEEYKNIFIKKLKKIDALRYSIIEHENRLSQEEPLTNDDLVKHQVVRKKFTDFVSNFEILKQNFRRFASHND